MDEPKLPAFVLAAPADFWWTVRVPVPTDDDYEYAALRVKFAWASQAELDKMRGVGLAAAVLAQDGTVLTPGEAAPTDEQIALDKVRGFELKDADGDAVAFNAETLGALLDAPMVRSAIVATYMAAMNGMAARKNASKPPAAG